MNTMTVMVVAMRSSILMRMRMRMGMRDGMGIGMGVRMDMRASRWTKGTRHVI